MEIDLKSLISKLDATCNRALQGAAGLVQSRTNYEIEPEHLLVKLNEDSNNDLAHILRRYEINADQFGAGLNRALDKMRTGNSRMPGISNTLVELVKQAWVVSTVTFDYGKVRSGTLLIAMLGDNSFARVLGDISRPLANINIKDLEMQFEKICEGSSESAEVSMTAAPGAAAASVPGQPGAKTGGKTPNLDAYTIDLTASAKAGKIDPVLGRDREIRQIIDILTRRRQNNPIMTGEAGVGKTAVVEGFALRVAAGDVPPQLQNVMIRSLDLGLLQAGAGMKGEFENRLKGVIEEVKKSVQPIIMFIDEAHTMIGAGGQAGQGDAANLLKPALARGELRTIAATTWAEYKKYFEKDAALARRFQPVKVDEPTEPVAITMMRGLAGMFEKHHDVIILEEAVEASVSMSARYISGRQLPDKSVSLLDTASARVGISQTAIPGPIEDARRDITMLEVEQRFLKAEQAAGGDHADRLAELETELTSTQEKLTALEEQWEKEKELVANIRESRMKLKHYAGQGDKAAEQKGKEAADQAVKAAADGKSADEVKKAVANIEPLSDAQAEEEREKLNKWSAELAEIQGEDPLMAPCVDAQTVAAVISNWTGIPVGRMVADQIQTVLNLKDLMSKMVVGQDHALDAIAARIRTSRANMDDPVKPIGVFMLVGPSGVGKTETAISLANLLYGGERNLITINMSEYQEAHTVSGLKGSPPGYVGYGEGGRLTEAVRRAPYSVVLLDEVEKAHPDVMELFFQVFDKGQLEDGEGRMIDFKNTVILLTSNVATDTMMELCDDPENFPSPEELHMAIRPELEKAFPPALLGRLVVSPYYPLSDKVLGMITRLKLGKIVRRVKENHGVPFTYTDDLVDAVVGRCTEASSGARNVDNILTNGLLPELSAEILTRMVEDKDLTAIEVDVKDDEFVYNFS